MMRIVASGIFAILLTACSGSSRLEDILRANTPQHPATQYTARKSHLENHSTLEAEARTTAEAEPQEAQTPAVQNLSEE
jgi:hypothetical protein